MISCGWEGLCDLDIGGHAVDVAQAFFTAPIPQPCPAHCTALLLYTALARTRLTMCLSCALHADQTSWNLLNYSCSVLISTLRTSSKTSSIHSKSCHCKWAGQEESTEPYCCISRLRSPGSLPASCSSRLCCAMCHCFSVWFLKTEVQTMCLTSLLCSSNTAMFHKLKCLHWGLPCFQLSFHWCLTQYVRTRVLGLFHPNNQFSPDWILDCSVHLPYSLQGVGSTWCFRPLPQSHELFLTTHQLFPSPWMGLSWNWVYGSHHPAQFVPILHTELFLH